MGRLDAEHAALREPGLGGRVGGSLGSPVPADPAQRAAPARARGVGAGTARAAAGPGGVPARASTASSSSAAGSGGCSCHRSRPSGTGAARRRWRPSAGRPASPPTRGGRKGRTSWSSGPGGLGASLSRQGGEGPANRPALGWVRPARRRAADRESRRKRVAGPLCGRASRAVRWMPSEPRRVPEEDGDGDLGRYPGCPRGRRRRREGPEDRRPRVRLRTSSSGSHRPPRPTAWPSRSASSPRRSASARPRSCGSRSSRCCSSRSPTTT